MSDSGRPAEVVNRQPDPSGGIPKRAVLGMVCGAVVLTVAAVGLFGGSNDPVAIPTAVVDEPAPDPERLRNYERDLAVRSQAEAEERAEEADTEDRRLLERRMDEAEDRSAHFSRDSVDEDAARRERESLFAGNVVLSRRPEAERLVDGSAAGSLRRGGAAADPQMPSLDEVTQSVLRAMGPPQAAGPLPAPPPAPSASQVAPQGGPAAGLHRVFEGTILDAVLTNRLDGSSTAPVNAMVTTGAYAHDGTLVVPAGARVLGTTTPVQSFGESRLAVAFHRLILPNGESVSLDKFAGFNARGDSGLKDQVNGHYLSTFGAAAAVGLIGGLAQAVASGWGGQDNTTVIIGGAGDAAAGAATQVMGRFLNRMPTVTIREGHRLKVYLTSDLDLPEYER